MKFKIAVDYTISDRKKVRESSHSMTCTSINIYIKAASPPILLPEWYNLLWHKYNES